MRPSSHAVEEVEVRGEIRGARGGPQVLDGAVVAVLLAQEPIVSAVVAQHAQGATAVRRPDVVEDRARRTAGALVAGEAADKDVATRSVYHEVVAGPTEEDVVAATARHLG